MTLAAVLGGAAGGMAELENLRTFAHVNAVYAVNDAAAEYPGELEAFVTLHPEKLNHWLTIRRHIDGQRTKEVIAHEMGFGVTRVSDYHWPNMTSSGSSGLFAVKVALEKFDKVVLCGVPMDAKRAHFFSPDPWFEVDSFWSAWETSMQFIEKRVRSMSGRTRDLLGFPTSDFLIQEQKAND